MTLNEYLKSPGALTVAELRIAVGAKSDAQVRQWQHGYDERLPSRENCPLIEKATGGKVTCEELRPNDTWKRIADPTWPWHKKGRPFLDVTRIAA